MGVTSRWLVECFDTVRVSLFAYSAVTSGMLTFGLCGQQRHGVFAEVATVGAVPFVVLLDQDVSGQAQ